MQPVNPALALYVSILRSLTEPETDFEHDRARAALFGLAEEAEAMRRQIGRLAS